MPAKIQNPFTERVAHVYPSGCHEWTGKRNRDGYGIFRDEGAHRVALSWVYGPISEGWYVDHECRNRRCVNVRHLRIVTPEVNGLENTVSPRALLAARTHCPKGHPFPPRERQKNGSNRRRCKPCWDAYHKAYNDAVDKEKSNAYQRHRYALNREKVLARQREKYRLRKSDA